MPPTHRHDIFWKVFTSNLHSPDFVAILSVLSPAETEATYDWLDDTKVDQGKSSARAFTMAGLKEVTGDRAGALSAYQTLKKQMEDDDALLGLVNLHIEHLSKSH
jgi:hypothetical protein